MREPVDPRAALFPGPALDFSDQGAGDALATGFRRGEQVLEVADVCGRRARVDEEVHDPDELPVDAGSPGVDSIILLEAAPRLVVVLLRPVRALVERVVAGEQFLPGRAVPRFEPPDRDHDSPP